MDGSCLTQQSIACELEIDDYIKIFEIINQEYTNYCSKWIKSTGTSINLKKKCIKDIYDISKGIDEVFKSYMDSYINGLLRLYSTIIRRINSETKVIIRGRVKEPQSILYKIRKKYIEENGNFPIIKSLNDLLGIRIIDINYKNNIDKIKEYLNSVEYKARYMERINSDYIGYHVYFRQEENIYFPMELQIWDVENEQTNINSHTMYKQEYISWANDYKTLEERGE